MKTDSLQLKTDKLDFKVLNAITFIFTLAIKSLAPVSCVHNIKMNRAISKRHKHQKRILFTAKLIFLSFIYLFIHL